MYTVLLFSFVEWLIAFELEKGLDLFVCEGSVVEAQVIEKARVTSAYANVDILSRLDGPKIQQADIIYHREFAVPIEPDIIVEIGQFRFLHDSGYVMPLVVAYALFHVEIAAARSDSDTSPDKAAYPHLS